MRACLFIVSLALPIAVFSQEEKPVYVVDGFVIDSTYELINNLPLDQIESISLYRIKEDVIKNFNLEFKTLISIKFKKGFENTFVFERDRILSENGDNYITLKDGNLINADFRDGLNPIDISSIDVLKNILDNPWDEVELGLVLIKTRG